MEFNNAWLENSERNLVLNTCYEISLLTNTSLFCNLFNSNINTFKSIGINDDNYKELLFILKDKLINADKFYLEYSLLYDMFKEIALRVDATYFLELFKKEENPFSFLGISDEKYKSLSLNVNDVRNIIIFENNVSEKKLLLNK